MAQAIQHDVEVDHATWLRDIERWDYDLRIWSQHRESLLDDARNLIALVEQFAKDVDAHQEAVDQHRQEIIECERKMFSGRRSDEDQLVLDEFHRRADVIHHRQFAEHQRLEQLRHNLCTRLAMLHAAGANN